MRRHLLSRRSATLAQSTAMWLLSFGDLLTLLLCFFLALVATGELQLGQAKVSSGEKRGGMVAPSSSQGGTPIASNTTGGVELWVAKSELGTLKTQALLVGLRDEMKERVGSATIHACGRDTDEALSFGGVMLALLGEKTSRMSFGGRECALDTTARAKIVVSYGK